MYGIQTFQGVSLALSCSSVHAVVSIFVLYSQVCTLWGPRGYSYISVPVFEESWFLSTAGQKTQMLRCYLYFHRVAYEAASQINRGLPIRLFSYVIWGFGNQTTV